ncbi:universal stress protein [Cecembia lonarensis]|uniref:Universal stress protein family protein n=1 Tax=Cecembia lonarensis (strain CCUG 58316 / KCTC 22772 / LW9) TaxID=1225176 RepID=K1LEJ6_CECL9|nr:universal stress protein [Cecembia lonarensis]EKB50602.1 Universal stress protein family protein [Cecembia lonarensis LW9]
MFKRIALAVAFSPRMEALICEAKRLKEIFDAELFLIHVGEKIPELEKNLESILEKQGLKQNAKLVWKNGNPAKEIIRFSKENQIDLLVAGALKTEGFFKYYIGSVARKIIRKASCSVLMLIEPLEIPTPFEKVVINGTQHDQTPFVIQKGLDWCKADKAKQVYVVNEIKMYGMQMATAGEGGEEEIGNTRRKLVAEEVEYVEKILKTLDKGELRVHIKITCGKWAVELARFAEDIKADLLVVGDEGKLGFLDRLFPHDLEDILSDLPCNVLIVKK